MTKWPVCLSTKSPQGTKGWGKPGAGARSPLEVDQIILDFCEGMMLVEDFGRVFHSHFDCHIRINDLTCCGRIPLTRTGFKAVHGILRALKESFGNETFIGMRSPTTI